MKVLIIDVVSCGLDFAMRCEAAGHEVRLWTGNLKGGMRSPVGEGLVKKVESWQGSMNWADLIFLTDNVKQMKELEPYRKRGYPIFGPSVATANWELERQTGQDVMKAAGIPVIDSVHFSDYEKAKAFVASSMKRYVSKPSGDADKALSYVSKGPADMIFMLDYWKRAGKNKASFLLQEFVPGIEMAVGGWFGRNGFSDFVLENFEHKKLMNGDIDVNTGEMGTVMKYVHIASSKLAQEVLLPLEGELYRQGYTGFIDVAVIIDKEGNPWPLEFTTRPGWPLFYIQQILHQEPVQWMADMLEGRDSFIPSPEIALGVVIAMPDFPYSTYTNKQTSGFPVWGITDKNRYHIHPASMQLGTAPVVEGGKLKDKSMMVTAGDYVLITSGSGQTVSQAKKGAYEVAKELEIPNSPMYRTDIGDRLEKQLKELYALGYATEWKF